MKNNSTKIFIIVGVLIVGFVLFYFLYNNKNEKKFSWLETYSNTSKEPYGTYLLYETLKQRADGFTLYDSQGSSIQEVMDDSINFEGNYIFVGEELIYNQEMQDSLFSFVSKGNNAFISSKVAPYELLDYLTEDSCLTHLNSYLFRSDVSLSIEKDAQKTTSEFSYIYKWEDRNYSWTYYDSIACYSEISSLGMYEGEYANFISIPYGDGFFYFHSTPLVLTNFFLNEEKGLFYAEKVLSHLPKGDVYWDEHSKLPFAMSENDPNRESPLRFILSQRGLKWAWYFTLLSTIIFVVFRSKRKQRMIPIIKPPENSSIEYTETIGELYFQQNDHKKLAQMKMKLFLEFIRNHYFIATHEINDQIINQIVSKSMVPEDSVQAIFRMSERMEEVVEVSDELLTNFHATIQNFYNQCK